jgi:hypothetical protein
MGFGEFGEVDFKKKPTIVRYILGGDFGKFVD